MYPLLHCRASRPILYLTNGLFVGVGVTDEMAQRVPQDTGIFPGPGHVPHPVGKFHPKSQAPADCRSRRAVSLGHTCPRSPPQSGWPSENPSPSALATTANALRALLRDVGARPSAPEAGESGAYPTPRGTQGPLPTLLGRRGASLHPLSRAENGPQIPPQWTRSRTGWRRDNTLPESLSFFSALCDSRLGTGITPYWPRKTRLSPQGP